MTATTVVSDREAEVLEAIRAHLTNAQIAGQLHISIRTVESHVSSLLRKFAVPDRRSLALLAPAVAARGEAGTSLTAGLPTTKTSFIGRSDEQAEVIGALAENRLVTLLGPGGVGKTRLAARVMEATAAEYPLGAAFVDLVPVREGYVAQAAAAVLGVSERAGQSLDAVLHEYFGRGRALLVLDNCEHLLDVAAVFAEKLLVNCDHLTVLATSRERLGIAGERIVRLRPLSVAPSTAEDLQCEAETLFMDRARSADPGFSAAPAVVRELCARLDGMPLAIEIAATRSVSLGADGLLAGLEDHLRLLAGHRVPAERHSSLRAVIDWSYDRLDDDEQRMFRRLGIFVAGFDLAAATAATAMDSLGETADLVGKLTDKSLLVHRHDAVGSRWQMLGTIRSYALDRLAACGEEAMVGEAHLRWAAATAAHLDERLVEAGDWQAEFDLVADDLRAAAAGAAGPDDQQARHRLAHHLGHLTYARRFLGESREHYRAAGALAAQPGEAAGELRDAAYVALTEGNGSLAFDLMLASADQAAAAGDGSGRAVALASAATIADRFAANFPDEKPHELLRRLVAEAAEAAPADDPVAAAYQASAAAWTANPEKTVPDPSLVQAALTAARRTGDPVLMSAALDGVVVSLDTSGRLRDAHQVCQERASLLTRMPRHDPRAGAEIVDTLYMVTEIAMTAGDLPAALAAARMAQDDDIASGQPHMSASKAILPLVLQGQFDQALGEAEAMWQAWVQARRPPGPWMGRGAYAALLAHGLRGDDEGFQTWQARIRDFVGADVHQPTTSNLASLAAFAEARIALHEGRPGEAVAAVADLPLGMEPWYGTVGWQSLRPYAWAIAAEVSAAAGSPDANSRLAAAAPAGEENYWAAACLARAAGRLTGDRAALERSLEGWERIEARFERACTMMLLEDRAEQGEAELRALGCRLPAPG